MGLPVHNYAYLDGHTVVPVESDDVLAWANLYERDINKRRVAETRIGNMWVSTVFLGINHAFTSLHRPQWFETMVFANPEEGLGNELYMERYETWDEAEEGHWRAVRYARTIGDSES